MHPISVSVMRRMLLALRKTPFHPQWLLPSREWANGFLRSLSVKRVLDIGCADRWMERCLQPEVHYVGLDYPATGATLYRASPDVFADAALLPIASESVDVVAMLEVLEHIEHPRDALSEAARVLVSEGSLLLSMPFLYPIHDAPHDFQRYTEHGLQRELRLVGLDVIRVEPTLDSLRSAGLMACLALAGSAQAALRRRMLSAPLIAVLAALAIPFINVFTWVTSMLLPSWPGLTIGYRLVATKSPRAGDDRDLLERRQ